jgi:Immunity protein Imm1
MVTVSAKWGTYSGWHGRREISNAQQSLSLCAEIEAREDAGPVILGFTSSSGAFFAIGLGTEHSCATYQDGLDPPYFQSLGTHGADDLIDFAYDGQHTEFPGTVRISRESALLALAEFMGTGQRPNCIEWEET